MRKDIIHQEFVHQIIHLNKMKLILTMILLKILKKVLDINMNI